MRRLFTKCPNCGSKKIQHATVKTLYTNFDSNGKVESRSLIDAQDAGVTRCLDCNYEETP